ncbi:SAVED domain-containing protein [Actinophytocola oryzae]|uniref:TIR domain-containing protein n=1 Tax=Actinophytocola oryzae TaxID=502181 RepID=A0A4R7VHH7_9PSEU|nr:SAVED domain-containing protein [Actinophytocola oryzae]TDV48803.1 TIR domain-containing protein [Actinophytocola oryzae]
MDVHAGRADDAETLVFVNYRSGDGASLAALLHAELCGRFGSAAVFLDHESLPLGRNFAPVLVSRVRGCAVLLVVVGDRWLDGVVGQRRIDDPEDWVRREIVEALNHDMPVVPVLFDGARLSADRLPAELAALTTLQYFEIRARRLRQDVVGLADELARRIPRLRGRPKAAVAELGPRDGRGRSVLSVATLRPDPMADLADHALDWVDRVDGASAYLRRRPLAPATWAQLQADIEAIPESLPHDRLEVLVTGSLRQATSFAVGGALRMVTGMDVAVSQRGTLWSSSQGFDAPSAPVAVTHHVGSGEDLAVSIAVAVDPTDDVLAFVKVGGLPVERLVSLSPGTGIRDNAIDSAAMAAAFAQGCRDAVRKAARHSPRIHLFLAGPTGLALLLGHRWNRLRPTLVYEDVQSAVVYEHAFTLDA